MPGVRIVRGRVATLGGDPVTRRRKHTRAVRTVANAQRNAARVGVLSRRLQRLLGGDDRVADAFGRLTPAEQAEAKALMRALTALGMRDWGRLADLAEQTAPGATVAGALPEMTGDTRREAGEILARRGKAGGR